MQHEWIAKSQCENYPSYTNWVCKNCGMDCTASQMPKREKIIAYTNVGDEYGVHGKKRFSCEEYVLHMTMET